MSLLWPDYTQSSAQTNLRQSLYHLRKAVPAMQATGGKEPIPFLLTDRQTVQINPEFLIELDVLEFIRLLKGPLVHWKQALDLYRGDFLSDFYISDCVPFEEWADTNRADFRNQALSALGRLTDVKIEDEAYQEAEGYARRQLEIEPLHESAYRQLMTVLASIGQRSQALILYDSCRQLLQAELHIEPSAETIAVFEAIRSGKLDKVVLVSERVEDSSAHTDALDTTTQLPLHNLPPEPTPFIGRELELEALDAFIDDPEVRLITIVSPGGMGKTRLAIAAAANQLDREQLFGDGVTFVSLASISSPEEIITTTAEALNFKFVGDGGQSSSPSQQLLDYLHPKQLLLIMDNFEHLLDGVSFLTEILRNAPGVQIIVTSRERLHLTQEQVYPIEGLEYIAGTITETAVENFSDYSAVSLFLQSAKRVQPGFYPTGDNITHIFHICQLVDGMPLALELAASWVNVLSLSDIAGEIQGSIDFLQSDLRDLPRRQRTMRAVFDSTWDRLTEHERDVFSQISVFRAGFTHEAARVIAGASLALLASLVNKSILRYEDGDDRYHIHELVRQYAAEKLSQRPKVEQQVCDRHSAYYCQWLSNREDDLKSARFKVTLSEIEFEIDNIRAAWNWAVTSSSIEQIETCKDCLGFLYDVQGYSHLGVKAFRSAVELVRENPSAVKVLISLLTWQAIFERKLGYGDESNRLLREARSILNSPLLVDQDIRSERAFVLLHTSLVHFDSDRERSASLCKEALGLFREIGDRFWVTTCLVELGLLARAAGDYEHAFEYIEEALAIKQELGDNKGIIFASMELSNMLIRQGRLEEGEQMARKSFAMAQEMGTWFELMRCYLALGAICFKLGKFSESHTLNLRGIELAQQRGDKFGITWGTTLLGLIMLHLGEYSEAYAVGQQALRFHQEMGVRGFKEYALSSLGWEALGLESYAEAEQFARDALPGSRRLGDVWREHLSLVALGFALLKLGKIQESQRYFLEAIQQVVNLGGIYPRQDLPGIALLLAEEGDIERAIELYTLARKYPFVANSIWWHDAVGKHIEALTANLPEAVLHSAESRGRALDLQHTAEDLLEELPARGW